MLFFISLLSLPVEEPHTTPPKALEVHSTLYLQPPAKKAKTDTRCNPWFRVVRAVTTLAAVSLTLCDIIIS